MLETKNKKQVYNGIEISFRYYENCVLNTSIKEETQDDIFGEPLGGVFKG